MDSVLSLAPPVELSAQRYLRIFSCLGDVRDRTCFSGRGCVGGSQSLL